MTLEQYKQERQEIIKKHKQELLDFDKTYALKNNPYKIGDIIQDHIGKLQIQSIGIYLASYNGIPTCFYRGIELKNDGTPRKRQDPDRIVYQTNIK